MSRANQGTLARWVRRKKWAFPWDLHSVSTVWVLVLLSFTSAGHIVEEVVWMAALGEQVGEELCAVLWHCHPYPCSMPSGVSCVKGSSCTQQSGRGWAFSHKKCQHSLFFNSENLCLLIFSASLPPPQPINNSVSLSLSTVFPFGTREGSHKGCSKWIRAVPVPGATSKQNVCSHSLVCTAVSYTKSVAKLPQTSALKKKTNQPPKNLCNSATNLC